MGGDPAMVKLSHRIEYGGFVLARSFFERMGLDLGTSVAATLSRPLTPLFRQRALRNLRLAMPDLSEADHRRIVAGMADHLTRVAIEYLHLPELRDTPDRVTIQGIEHLERARAAGRGAVLVTGHFGNWEAVRVACARIRWPPAILYRKFNNTLVDAEAQRRIGALNAPIFHKGKRGTLGMLRHIRQGGAAMILCDQRFGGAPEIPFFGIPAKTSLAPAEIALEYGAALIPVRGIRCGKSSRFTVTIDAPLDLHSPGMNTLSAMAEINTRLEHWIRADPEQYFWLHNRWGNPARNRQ